MLSLFMFHPDGPAWTELVRQAMTSVERGYDMLAPKFELTPFRTPEPIVVEIARRVGSVRAALDVCCGTGAALGALRAVCTDRLTGVDLSEGMLAVAAERVPDVELVRADALDMPFHREFDAAVCAGAFGHIEKRDEPRLLGSIVRALRPGGRFVFATSEVPPWTSPSRVMAEGFNAVMRVRNALWDPPFVMYYLTFTWPEVRGRLLAAGFVDVECIRDALGPPFENVLFVIASIPDRS